jgi:hypothetical protein
MDPVSAILVLGGLAMASRVGQDTAAAQQQARVAQAVGMAVQPPVPGAAPRPLPDDLEGPATKMSLWELYEIKTIHTGWGQDDEYWWAPDRTSWENKADVEDYDAMLAAFHGGIPHMARVEAQVGAIEAEMDVTFSHGKATVRLKIWIPDINDFLWQTHNLDRYDDQAGPFMDRLFDSFGIRHEWTNETQVLHDSRFSRLMREVGELWMDGIEQAYALFSQIHDEHLEELQS